MPKSASKTAGKRAATTSKSKKTGSKSKAKK